jgi:ATP-binding cassette subfamily F protein 2
MESIDSLAKAVNEFEGGMVLVSHDMRLISQVAQEIWVCDNKTITKYRGDIQNFKMDMRAQLDLEDDGKTSKGNKGKLRGDASVMKKTEEQLQQEKKKASKSGGTKSSNSNSALDSLLTPKPRDPAEGKDTTFDVSGVKDSLPKAEPAVQERPKYIPPHLRNRS